MNRLERALEGISTLLTELDVGFALVGGLAVSAQTEPRFTRDIDLVVAVADDREAEHIIRSLTAQGYSAHTIVEQEETSRLATVRMSSAREGAEGVVVDLLFASSGIENEIVSDAEELEIMKGIVLPIASLSHLIALKILARNDEQRPQDISDLKKLLALVDKAGLDKTYQALKMIQARGFNRNRDLIAHLDELLSSDAPI